MTTAIMKPGSQHHHPTASSSTIGDILGLVIWLVCRIVGIWVDKVEVQVGSHQGGVVLWNLELPEWVLCRLLQHLPLHIGRASIEVMKLQFPWPWTIAKSPVDVQVKGLKVEVCPDVEKVSELAASKDRDRKQNQIKKGPPLWLTNLLLNLRVSLHDISLAYDYDLRELDPSGWYGADTALVLALKAVSLGPVDEEGKVTGLDVGGMSLGVVVSEDGMQSEDAPVYHQTLVLQDLGWRLRVHHHHHHSYLSEAVEEPVVIENVIGGGQDLGQAVAIHLDKMMLQTIAGGGEILSAAIRRSRPLPGVEPDEGRSWDDETEGGQGFYDIDEKEDPSLSLEMKSEMAVDVKLSMPGLSLTLDLPPMLGRDPDEDDNIQAQAHVGTLECEAGLRVKNAGGISSLEAKASISPSHVLCQGHSLLTLPLMEMSMAIGGPSPTASSLIFSMGDASGVYHPLLIPRLIDLLTSPCILPRATPILRSPLHHKAIAWHLTDLIGCEASKCGRSSSTEASTIALDVRIEGISLAIPPASEGGSCDSRTLQITFESIIAFSGRPGEDEQEAGLPQLFTASLQKAGIHLETSIGQPPSSVKEVNLLTLGKSSFSMIRTTCSGERADSTAEAPPCSAEAQAEQDPDKAWDWSELGVGGGSLWLDDELLLPESTSPLLLDPGGRNNLAVMWQVDVNLPSMGVSSNIDDVLEAIWLVGARPSSPQWDNLPSRKAYESRRGLHILPRGRSFLPTFHLQIQCPSIHVTLLPGRKHVGLPALGPIVLEASMPWQEPWGNLRSEGPILHFALPQGFRASHAAGSLSWYTGVRVPSLSLETSPQQNGRPFSIVQLSGLRIAVDAHPDKPHWTLFPEDVLMGVAERALKIKTSIEKLNAGVEPSLLRRLVHLLQAILKTSEISSRAHFLPIKASSTATTRPIYQVSASTVPLGPLLSVSISLPGRTSIKLYWGSNLSAEIVMKDTSAWIKSGSVGGPSLKVGGKAFGFEIIDGGCNRLPEMQKILCRLKHRRPSSNNTNRVTTLRRPMISWLFVGDNLKDEEGPRFLLRAIDWRFIYLQRVTMEIINYLKDFLVPGLKEAPACRPEDLLSQSIVHRLATNMSYQWRQGIPNTPSKEYRLGEPPTPTGKKFRLQILLLDSRVFLAESSNSTDSLIVDVRRYRLWRVQVGNDKDETFWKGQELETMSYDWGQPEEDGSDSYQVLSGEGGIEKDEQADGDCVGRQSSFYEPENDGLGLAAMLIQEADELEHQIHLLEEQYAHSRITLLTEQSSLEAIQASLDSVMSTGSHERERHKNEKGEHGSVATPLSAENLSVQLVSQLTKIDELERQLSESGEYIARLSKQVKMMREEAANVRHHQHEKDQSRWQHGVALPVKPANRLDMELTGASISTWKAGLVGKDIHIHAYIEPGKLRYPQGDPQCIYPLIYSYLGFKHAQNADTNNTGTTVALFVHDMQWVFSRSQYVSLLALLLENCREPCPYVPPIRPIPPPPGFEEIRPGPSCITLPPSVSVPVYFECAHVRLVEDISAGDDVGKAVAATRTSAWRKDEKVATSNSSLVSEGWPSTEVLLSHTAKNPDYLLQARGPLDGGAAPSTPSGWLDDEGSDPSEEDEGVNQGGSKVNDDASTSRVICKEEDEGYDFGVEEEEEIRELLLGEGGEEEEDEDLLVSLHEAVGRPVTWRNPAAPIKPEEYVATIVLRTACLSIDRRPNNKGLELSVTSEQIDVKDEMGSSGDMSQEPAKIIFPSSKVTQGLQVSAAEPTGERNGPSQQPSGPVPRVPDHFQLRYIQQNLGPYRRCAVEVAQSVIVGAGERMVRMVDFLVQPIRDRGASNPPPPQEQPRNMDLEVNITNSLVCLMEDLFASTSAAIFANLQLDYLHKWRGLVQNGPGTVDANFNVSLQSVFLSRNGLALGRCLPLASPFTFRIQMLTDIIRRNPTDLPNRHRSLILDLHGLSNKGLQRQRTSLEISSSALSTSRSPRSKGRKIDFYLSVPDFRLFLKMTRTLAAGVQAGRRQTIALALSKAQAKVEETTEGGVGENDSSISPPSLERTGSTSSTTDSSRDDGRDSSVSNQQQQQQQRSTTQIFVSFGDLHFTLVNNSVGIPLAYLALLSTDFRLQQQDSQGLDMAGSFALRAGYFNQRTYQWEPALETVHISGETRKKSAGGEGDDSQAHAAAVGVAGTKGDDNDGNEAAAAGVVQIQLDVLRPLNVNVSHALLALTRNEALVTDLLVHRSGKAAPYVVRNRCGDRLQVNFRRSQRLVHNCALTDQEDVSLDFRNVCVSSLLADCKALSPDQALVATDMPEIDNEDEDQAMQQELMHSLTLRLDHRGWSFQSPEAISMDVVGLYEAKLFPDGPVDHAGLGQRPSASQVPPGAPALITEVDLQYDGSKVVTVRSRISIQNRSGVPLYLLIAVPRNGSRPFFSEEVVLAPDDIKYVSVSQLGPETAFFVRASPELGWAPILDNIADMDSLIETAEDSSALLVCESPPLDEDAPQVPNDDHEDPIIVGSCSIGIEIRTQEAKNGFGLGLDIPDSTAVHHVTHRKGSNTSDESNSSRSTSLSQSIDDSSGFGGAGVGKGGDEGPTSPPSRSPVRVQRSFDKSKAGQSASRRESMESIPGITGETLHIKKWSLPVSGVRLRELAAGMTTRSSRMDASHRSTTRLSVTRIVLRPVFVLHNLHPCPLLYRLCDKNGYVTAEGALPVGVALPLFRVSVKIKQYLSVRMVNYLWSTYTRVHVPKAAYPTREAIVAVELKSLSHFKGKRTVRTNFDLPTQVVNVSLLGRHIRLFAKVAIVNRSNLVLQYKDGSMTADVAGASTPAYLRQNPLGLSQTRYSVAPYDDGPPPSSTTRSDSLRGMAPSKSSSSDRLTTKGRFRPTAGSSTQVPRSASSVSNSNLGKTASLELEGSQAIASGLSGAATNEATMQGIAINVRLPYNHLDTVTLSAHPNMTLGDVFALLIEKVHVLNNATIEDYEFTHEDVVDGQTDHIGLKRASSSLNDHLQLIKSTLSSNRTNLYDAEHADRLCFLSGPVRMILDKRSPLSDLSRISSSGKTYYTFRLLHGVEVDINYQVAQSSNDEQAMRMLNPATSLSATLRSSSSQSLDSRRIPSSSSNVSDRESFSNGSPAGASTASSNLTTAQYQEFSPGIPFCPPNVLGQGVQIAMRSWDSEWSASVDVPLQQAIGTVAYNYLSLKQRGQSRDRRCQYDLGLIMKPCDAPFHRTSLLTFVPRYVLVNRLEVPLEYSQTGCLDSWMGVLPPGDEASFHWPWADRKKLIQVRISSLYPASEGSWQWTADFPIDSIGEMNVKLRKTGNTPQENQIAILKMTMELVQATVMISLSIQDPEWPPYRVDNLTSYNIRYRQVGSVLTGSGGPVVEHHDYLAPNSSASYAWDIPTSGSKLFQLEFQQGNRWEQREYSMDELKKHSRIKLSRSLPDLSETALEGFLDMFRPQANLWVRVYCVVKGPVVYVFANEHKLNLRVVVNMGATGLESAHAEWALGTNYGNNKAKRAIITQHQHVVTDIFSIIKANLNQTTSKLNSMLLMGDDEERRILEYSLKNEKKREVLGIVAFQLARYLATQAAVDTNQAASSVKKSKMSPAPSTANVFSSGSGMNAKTMSGAQWLSLLMESGFAKDVGEAHRLAMDLFFGGHLLPLSIMGGSQPFKKASTSSSASSGTSPSRSSAPPLQPRPPSGPPPNRSTISKGVPSPIAIRAPHDEVRHRSSRNIGEMLEQQQQQQQQTRRLRQRAVSNVSFTDDDVSMYMLVAPQRDGDIDTTRVPEFEIITALGNKSVFRCGSTIEMKRWIISLRDMVDRSLISSVLAEFDDKPDSSYGRRGSKGLQTAMEKENVRAKAWVRVQVRADGPTKVLEITEEHDGDDIEEEGLSTTNDGAENSRWRRRTKHSAGADTKRALFQCTSVNVYLRRVGISIIDEKPQETLYSSLDHLQLRADVTDEHVTVSLTIEGLQIDNQLENAGFAVVLRPRATPSKRREEGRHLLILPGLTPRLPEASPAFHFYARRINVASRDVLFFEAFSCWLRPLELKLEESVVMSLMRLKDAVKVRHFLKPPSSSSSRRTSTTMSSWSSAVPSIDSSVSIDLDGNDAGEECFGLSDERRWLLPSAELLSLCKPKAVTVLGPARGDGIPFKLYFAVLHLHPIDLTVSFKYMALQEAKDEDKEVFALGNMAQLDNAKVRLNALLVTDAFGAQKHIIDTILKHYQWGILRQLHTFFGSFDVIGNPVGLVTNLGTGVKDFFYEPWDGLASDGSLEAFLGGLGKGANSLLGNTMDGTFTAASKITGSLGQGLATLTLDHKYKHDRARRKAREAQSVSDGMVRGGMELGRGLFEGVTGVVMAPVRGAEQEGVMGFGKGLFKGIVGMAVKPAVGMFDFASKTTEGIKNFTRADILSQDIEQGSCGRIRPPRPFGPNGELKEYSVQDAVAQNILHSIMDGRYAAERVIWQMKLMGGWHGVNNVEGDEAEFIQVFKEDLAEIMAQDKTAPSPCVDMTPLLLHIQPVSHPVPEAPSAENCRALYLIFSDARALLIAKGLEIIWEAPLESIFDVAAVPLASCVAIRFGLHSPAALAEAQTAKKSQTNQRKSHSAHPATVYHSGLQLEFWLYALLEHMMPQRIAGLQRLIPSKESQFLRGYMERRDSGLLGVTIKSYYVLAGNLLYEYKQQGQLESLHMIIPLAGLKFSLSDRVIRISRGRPGKPVMVIKSTYSGPPGGGPSVKYQSLSEVKRDDIILVAPDELSARQWFAVLTHTAVDELSAHETPPKTTVTLPSTSKGFSPHKLPFERLQSLTENFMKGRNKTHTDHRPIRRNGAAASRNCMLYAPFDPHVKLTELQPIIADIRRALIAQGVRLINRDDDDYEA